MLIILEWSVPKPVMYGKDILVRLSHANFKYRIFVGGKSVEWVIHQRVNTISTADELVSLIQTPYISFRANTHDELHVDFEQL